MTTNNFDLNLADQILYGALANSSGFGDGSGRSSINCITDRVRTAEQEIQRIKELHRQTLQQNCDTITQLAKKHRVEMTKMLEENEDLKKEIAEYRVIALRQSREIETLHHETHPFPLTPDNSRLNHVEQDLISQEDFRTENLYWGASCGHVTIWRLPEDLTIPDDMDFGDVFGNAKCLGEEWGGLNSVCIKTVTQEMIDAERFE
jgi:hypothetical protein